MVGRKIDGAKGAATRMHAMRRPLATAVAMGLLMGMAAPAAQAVDSHWRGTVSTDWSDVANWDAVPAAGGHVFIDTTSPHGSVLTAPGVEIDQLTVGDQATGALTLSGGGTLAVHSNDMNDSGAVFGQAKGSTGSVTVTGTGSTLTVDQGVQVGSEGTGSLSVTAGGTANLALGGPYSEVLVGYGYYGQSPDAANGSGTVEVDGAGSTLNYAGGFNLLNGSLTVSNGGRLESHVHAQADGGWIDVLGLGQVATSPDSLVQEYALDGQGTATITGAGSSWQGVNSLEVGDGGTGRLSILDGATASFGGKVTLGREIVTYDYTKDPVTGASTNTPVGSMQGNGTIEVSGEGSALAVVAVAGLGNGDLVVGGGGDGTLSVDDKGSVDVAGVLTVGDQTKGVLTVTGGGTLAAHGSDANFMSAVLGAAAGSEGDVTVSGAGSTLTLDAGAQIGNFGSGSLTVQQGGVVNIGLATAYSETVVGLGYYGSGGPDAAKGTGAVTVDGVGSTLNYAGGMNVLNGDLTVSNGGQLVSQVRSGDQGSTWLDTIGYGLPADDDIQFQQLNGTATATVTGAGSTWNSVNALDVGTGGTGTLNVLDGGKATFTGWGYVGDEALLYDSGTSTGLTQAGTGTVNVSGDGSSLAVAALPAGSSGTNTGFFVGYKGDGSLSVADKGSVDVAGRLVVGSQAKGTLAISSGGAVAVHGSDTNGVGAVFGDTANSEGDVTVSGAGSALTVDAAMQVGNVGAGHLSVSDGGTVTASGGIGVGALGSVTIGGLGGDGSLLAPGMLDTPTITLQDPAARLQLQHDADDYRLDAVLAGNGQVVADGGFTQLTADSSAFAGSTTIDGGATLDVTGKLGGVLGGVGVSGDGTLQVTDGGSVHVTGADDNLAGFVAGHDAGSAGNVLVSGAGSTFTVDAGAQIGNFGSGSLTVQQGGVASIGQATAYSETVVGLGYYGSGGPDAAKGTGAVTVDGAGSTLDYAGGMNVLNGDLTVSNGGQLVSQVRSGDQGSAWLDTIGYGLPADDDIQFQQLNGTATATVTGAGSTWNSVNALDVGTGGTGTLNVLDGGKASFTGWGYVGDEALLYDGGTSTGLTQAGTGTVNVSGDGSSLAVAALPAGSTGTNTGLFVGYKGEGTFAVDDKGSVDVAGRLVVGGQAKGTLAIAGGGTMAVHGGDDHGMGVVLGDATGIGGDVTVSGKGSVLTVDAGAQIGNGGSGSLTVQQGGVANLGLATAGSGMVVGLGYYSNGHSDVQQSTGAVTVDGAGSTLNYAGGLDLKQGTLTVSNGGHLAGQARAADQGAFWFDAVGYGLGQMFNGQGTVTVSGAGSTWDSVNGLNVGVGPHTGDGDTGTVSILDGAQASFRGSVNLGLSTNTGLSGDIDMPGTATMLVSGSGSSLTVAAAPDGSNGGAGDLVVGSYGRGTLTVDDHASVDVAGQLAVGYQEGRSELTVSGGGQVSVHGHDANGMGVIVGNAIDESGTDLVAVSGSGSTLDVDGAMEVGNDAWATLSVEDGGVVNIHGTDAKGMGLVLGNNIDNVSNESGDVTVSGAGSVLAVAGGGRLGNMGRFSLSVTDGGAVAFHGPVSAGVSDTAIPAKEAVTHGSNITVSGAGSSLSIAASSSGSGDGTLKLGTSDNDFVQMAVRDGATVTVANGIDLGPQGTIVIGGNNPDGSGAGLFAPGTIDTPTLKLDAPYQTFNMLTFDHSASTEEDKYVFAADISGSGGISVMSGFTELTGDSSSYTGHVGVGGGTLSVNGSLGGDIDVLPGARLQGTGTVNDVTVGGTLAPGNSPGTLHVKGDLVMQAGSVYEAQIDPATGKSDSVEVAGNVTIQPGTTLEVQNLGDQPLTPGAQINLIQSTGKGTVQGQFDNTEGDITDFMGYGVTYQDGQVVVGVTRSSTSFASVGDTPQARALGTALDGVAPDSALGMLLFGQLTNAGQAALAFKQMTGVIHADVRRVMLDDSRQPRDAVEQRLQQAGDTEGTAWWVHALGDWDHADGSNGLAGAKADSSGGMVGVDTDVGDGSRLGVAAGLGQTSYRMGDQGSAHLKDRHLALYGRSVAGHLDLGYGLAATWHDIGTHRAFAVGTVPQQLNSDSHARTDQLFVDAGYRFGDSARRYVEPYVALAHVRLHSDAVDEHGGVTALGVASGSDHATFGTLGLRWSVGAGVAHWYGTLGWRHVFGFGRPTAQAQFAGSDTAFAVQGLPMARNAAQVELGASFPVGKRVHVSFGYDGLIAGSSRDNGAKAQLTMDF